MGKVKDFLVASGMVSGGVGGHVLARRMGAQNPFIAGGLPGAIAGTVVFLFIGRALDRAALQRHYARSKWEGVPKEDDESTSS